MQKVLLGIKRLVETDEWKVTVMIDGVYQEGPSAYTTDVNDAIGALGLTAQGYTDMGYEVSITKGARSLMERNM